jgi:hypothetical protein
VGARSWRRRLSGVWGPRPGTMRNHSLCTAQAQGCVRALRHAQVTHTHTRTCLYGVPAAPSAAGLILGVVCGPSPGAAATLESGARWHGGLPGQGHTCRRHDLGCAALTDIWLVVLQHARLNCSHTAVASENRCVILVGVLPRADDHGLMMQVTRMPAIHTPPHPPHQPLWL